ncbi:MAG: U32 family peptidase [Prevotellaceae bacterium]|jgi:putative protease|nr:U32 family peptidase [Prevotellaceae bacterium]
MAIHKLELLSPAKNADYGIAAINHGADAVYIAAQKFGAREVAGNSMADVERLAAYAHRYYAKVYLALNTIIYEQELEEARNIAIQAHNIGCDALIIQDMALLEMGLPPIPLHASTQTNNLDAEKVKFLENVGFTRVILGRELSMQEIAAIHEQTNVELEGFVHGALCVSHSGQCYLSQAIANRSANRGACAQPCRSAYDLHDAKGKLLLKNRHLLSLSDFNLSDKLEDLYKAGISSFKMEGRLKDLTYVKNITAYYRRQLDRLIAKYPDVRKSSSGDSYFNFDPKPGLSFNRGFTSYFIDGKQKKMASLNTPKHKGEELGKVVEIGNTWFKIAGNIEVNNGDGICFFDRSEILKGTKVNRVEKGRIYPLSMEDIGLGVEVFRNYNHAFEKRMSGITARRFIYADLLFKANEKEITITATDEDGISVDIKEPQLGEIAKNEEMALQSLKENLSKSGDSIFMFTPAITSDKVYFYPHAVVNAWRRQLAEKLEQARLVSHKIEKYAIEPNSIAYPSASLSYFGNIANSLARKFYERHGLKDIGDAFELNPDTEGVLMTTHYCIRRELGICTICTKGKVAGNAESLYLYNNGKRLRVDFDCERCGMTICKINR